jgi:hypothetical protein
MANSGLISCFGPLIKLLFDAIITIFTNILIGVLGFWGFGVLGTLVNLISGHG